ncbi:DinB/UmuC family translesion DNA polymerase [Spirosoma areae]
MKHNKASLGRSVTQKVKYTDFQQITRSHTALSPKADQAK